MWVRLEGFTFLDNIIDMNKKNKEKIRIISLRYVKTEMKW